MNVKERLKAIWESVKNEKVGDLVDKAQLWTAAVEHGADPIEALHGHLCGPTCMHWEAMTEARRAQLRKAPWNQGEQ